MNPGVISGVVSRVSVPENEPIAGVGVSACEYETGHWMGGAQSQSDGSYTITGLPAGSYRVRVEAIETDYLGEYYDHLP